MKMCKHILKKHSRTSPDILFKKFSSTKQKLDLERTISELGKPFPKNQIKKTENQCQNAACEQKTTSEKANFCPKRFLTKF